MTSRNKGILSPDFLVPTISLILSLLLVEVYYRVAVTPRVKDIEMKQKLLTAQGVSAGTNSEQRSIYVIIKDPEQQYEIVFALWGFAILGHKLMQVRAERRLFKHDFIRLQPGERIIPEDALDRYKELRTAVDRDATRRQERNPGQST